MQGIHVHVLTLKKDTNSKVVRVVYTMGNVIVVKPLSHRSLMLWENEGTMGVTIWDGRDPS